MPNTSLPVHIKTVLPMDSGSAVFLGNANKTIVIMIDTYVAHLMVHALQKAQAARPSTHELMGSIFLATGCRVERLVINDVDEGQFFARLILSMENEIREMKLMEIDCRPSDGMILALRSDAPILCAHDVWERCEDVTNLLTSLTSGSGRPQEDGPLRGGNESAGADFDDDIPF
jgi:uncharacterized protein